MGVRQETGKVIPGGTLKVESETVSFYVLRLFDVQ